MGHSLNYFELEKGFIWPDNSKLLANIFSLKTKKILAGVLSIIAAISFVVAGICVLIGHSWQQMVIIFAVIISTLLFVTFWDGSSLKLHTQGGIAIIINILILIFSFI
jgi:uncharacterized membrane protein YphA (DoxX/SURF4 family)